MTLSPGTLDTLVLDSGGRQMTTLTEEIIPLAGIACETNTGIDTRPLSSEPSFAYWQQDIPREYWDLDAKQLVARVAEARRKLGSRLIVLGHHYQREDIIQFADVRGDSFKLAQWAAQHAESEYIVFCGVHFMAEAADILSGAHQTVVLPNMAAGCSMADMADPEDVYACWEELEEAGVADKVVPVTYMNSAASLKAFCGKHGGIVCTSSNAAAVLKWAFERGEKVLFFPDQHLGRNTGAKMGVPLDRMTLWNYNRPYGSLGGMTLEELERSRILPEQDPAALQLFQGHAAQRAVGAVVVPQSHPVQRHAHLGAGVATQVLVREEQHLLAALEGPLEHGCCVAGGADDAAVLAAERLQ